MRSRNLLHKTKLEEFRLYCEAHGFQTLEPCGEYEVLRMRQQNSKEVLIVHTTLNAKEHVTVHGIAERMARNFVNKHQRGVR